MQVTVEDLRPYFPYEEARPGQLEYCVEIVNRYHQGARHVILQGPTGVGKSAINMCVADYFTSKLGLKGFCTMPLKTLQNQYNEDKSFSGLFYMMKGKNSYYCAVSGEREPKACDDLDYDERVALRGKCKGENLCSYFKAIEAAERSPLILNNTHCLLFQPFFGNRDFLIVDECHSVEDVLLGLYTYRINKGDFDLLNIDTEWQFPKIEMRDNKVQAEENETKCEDECGNEIESDAGCYKTQYYFDEDFIEWARCVLCELEFSVESVKDKEKEYHRLQAIVGNLREFLDRPKEWVCLAVLNPKSKKNPQYYELKPITVDKYAYRIIDKGSRFCLWSSATIVDPETFCRTLGIPYEKENFIDIPSNFPPENFPVKKWHRTTIKEKLTRNTLERNLPNMVADIDTIMGGFPERKGLIHTQSYKIRDYVIANSKNRHRMLWHSGEDREEVLKLFMESEEPVFLVSPSMTEGVDLKDDLGRVQIICKIPWPFLGDPQIKAKKEKDPKWYELKTTQKLVQIFGRIMRHKDDWGKTFVIDTFGFDEWKTRCWSTLPVHIQKAITGYLDETA
jgi:Rad3-related DNA helicase